jgi:hypothetical protein
VVRADRHDIAGAALADAAPQLKTAVDVVANDAAGGAAVLAGRASAVSRGRRAGGLVHDQHHVVPVLACGQVHDRPVPRGVQYLLLIAAGTGQQVLHPVRSGVPGGPGEGPAVVITELRKQAVHHVPAGQAGLPPGETRRDPRQQVLEQASMRVMIYCGISGCCVSVLFHKLA